MDSEKRDQAMGIEAEPILVQYVIYESAMARNERHVKRLLIIIVVLVALLFASNMIWLAAFSGFDYADYEVTADGGSQANYANLVGGDMDGEIYNGGKDKSTDTDETLGREGENNPETR